MLWFFDKVGIYSYKKYAKQDRKTIFIFKINKFIKSPIKKELILQNRKCQVHSGQLDLILLLKKKVQLIYS